MPWHMESHSRVFALSFVISTFIWKLLPPHTHFHPRANLSTLRLVHQNTPNIALFMQIIPSGSICVPSRMHFSLPVPLKILPVMSWSLTFRTALKNAFAAVLSSYGVSESVPLPLFAMCFQCYKSLSSSLQQPETHETSLHFTSTYSALFISHEKGKV